MVVIVAYDVSSVLPAPLPFIFATVDAVVLFDMGISGSGAGAETILLTPRKRKSPVNVRYAVASFCTPERARR